jgi:hypothetical protein
MTVKTIKIGEEITIDYEENYFLNLAFNVIVAAKNAF